jgi:hypothetical protein
MLIPFHLLKIYIRNVSLFFISLPSFYFLLSRFVKLLEANFSCFAKIRWMPSWFAKLLELLLVFNQICYDNLRWKSIIKILFLLEFLM